MAHETASGEAPVTAASQPPLRSLDGIRPLYMLPSDPLGEEVLIPGFRVAATVDCMVGFFSSEVLASLAPGLATYITGSRNSFRLIISPLLRDADRAAIEAGLGSKEAVTSRILKELTVTEDLLQRHTLTCLAWLLRERRIEIKVALMKDALFHPKVWLFEHSGSVVAAHGSSNVTHAGIAKNIEQIAISKSWQDPTQSYITGKLRSQFDDLWADDNDDCIVVSMPEAVRQHLLQTYTSAAPPTEDQLRKLYRLATPTSDSLETSAAPGTQPMHFTIPDGLVYNAGPFEHQGKAVAAWCDAGYRGVLEMATGSGKTITSMIGAHRLYEENKPLLIVISAPYVPLIEQWCDEVSKFGLKPVNLTALRSAQKRATALKDLRRRLRLGVSDVEAVVVSHDTLCKPTFRDSVEAFDCPRLLVGDEAHNLGRSSFVAAPPDFFEYRLGLSATPIRQYDDDGTEALLRFFGPVVFQYTLEDAIGRCLVEYDYYVHPVYLTTEEMDDWFAVTSRIKENAWRSEEGKPDNYLARLLRDRRALLEGASGKIPTLGALLQKENPAAIRHTLIYTSDKGRRHLDGTRQIDDVNRLLRERGILFHQLTAAENSNREHSNQILKSFQDGAIDVLTAMRVLDEGINVPQTCRAYILASTTVERQWVQRRGRLLRTCSAIGKTYAVIHDLLALPPNMEGPLDRDARHIVRTELRRAQAFARLARNAGRPDGPLAVIASMVDAAYL